MSDFSFTFAKRSYLGRFLPEEKEGQRDAIVFGVSLDPKKNLVYVILKKKDGWSTPNNEALTPLAKAAVAAFDTQD